jgi:hypothetical protein
MDKENVVYIPSGLSSSHKEERNHGVCRKMIETEDHRIMWSKPSSDRQRSHVLSYMWNLDINYTQKYIHTHIYTNTHTHTYICTNMHIYKNVSIMDRLSGGGERKRKMEGNNPKIHSSYVKRWYKSNHWKLIKNREIERRRKRESIWGVNLINIQYLHMWNTFV